MWYWAKSVWTNRSLLWKCYSVFSEWKRVLKSWSLINLWRIINYGNRCGGLITKEIFQFQVLRKVMMLGKSFKSQSSWSISLLKAPQKLQHKFLLFMNGKAETSFYWDWTSNARHHSRSKSEKYYALVEQLTFLLLLLGLQHYQSVFLFKTVSAVHQRAS